MVPQWYKGTSGNYSYTLNFSNNSNYSVSFYTSRKLTPNLKRFFDIIEMKLESIILKLEHINESISIEVLQEKLAIEWLQIEANDINWETVFSYNSILSNKTFENKNFSKNILFNNEEGKFNLLENENKILSQLASSNHTYFIVDYKFNFISYNFINSENRKRSDDYQLLPEFLILFRQFKKWSYHKTDNNDMIITNGYCIKLSKRKSKFTIYDPATFKNSINDYLECNYRTSCNLFELIFDLSYRRKGALLIYDPNGNISDYIINKDSIITSNETNILRQSINQSISRIKINEYKIDSLMKEQLIELCSIDGAVVFDDLKIKGYGSMIKTSSTINSFMGARFIAAKAIQECGFTSILVSSDGEINIFFNHKNQPQKISFF